MLTILLTTSIGFAGAPLDALDQQSAKDLERLIQDGQKAIDSGDLPHAFELLDAAKKLAPDDARVAFGIGKGYLWQAQDGIANDQTGAFIDSALKDAESSLTRAIELSPAAPDIAATLGRCLLLQGREADAAKQLETAETLGAHAPDFYLDLGDAHFGLYTIQKEAAEGDLGAAELKSAEQAYQRGRAQVIAAALGNLNADQLADASDLGATIRERCLQEIAHSEPSAIYSSLCRKLGFARWYANDAKQALAAFLEGVRVAPADPSAHQDLFQFINTDSTQLDDVIQLYRTMASEDPLRFWFLGQLEVSRGNKGLNYGNPRDATLHYFAAIAAFDTSVAVEPAYQPDANVWIAVCHSYAGRALTTAKSYRAAEDHFVQALALNKELADPIDGLDQLGGKLFNASEASEVPLADVRDFFDRITKIAPERADWWNNLGLFARDTEKYEQSYAAYEKAVALEPNNARFVNDKALILFYHLNRDLDQAEVDFKRAIELGRQDYEKAKDEQKDDAFSAYTDALVNLARLYHKQNRLDECRATLADLLKEAPGRPEAIELRAQLEEELTATR